MNHLNQIYYFSKFFPFSIFSSSSVSDVIKFTMQYACMLSCVWLFVTLWTVAHQAPLPIRFLGKNTGVGCHSLLQEIFLTQGLNLLLLCLLHCRLILYPPSQMIYHSIILSIFAYFASFSQQSMRLVPQYFSFYRKQRYKK